MKTTAKRLNSLVCLSLLTGLVLPFSARAQTDIFAKNSDSTTPSGLETVIEDQADEVLPPAINVPRPDKVVRSVITAYTSTPDQTDDDPFIAATGKRVHDGMIAANWLPFGTKIKIPALYGDKIFVVEDRMNSRYGYGRLDIWLDASKKEGRKFGVKRVDVEVYYAKKELSRR